jgi:preprotein translocase subunit SecF
MSASHVPILFPDDIVETKDQTMSELINQSINQSNTRYYWMVVVTPLPP